MPYLRDGRGDANVVGLEGVQRNAEKDGADSEGPHGSLADGWNALHGKVVDDT